MQEIFLPNFRVVLKRGNGNAECGNFCCGNAEMTKMRKFR